VIGTLSRRIKSAIKHRGKRVVVDDFPAAADRKKIDAATGDTARLETTGRHSPQGGG
jgi:hypothetical protein